MSTLTKLDLNFNTLIFSIYLELEYDNLEDFYKLDKIVACINGNTEDSSLFRITGKELFDVKHIDKYIYTIADKKVTIPLVREVDMDIANTGFINIYADNLKNASVIYIPKKSTNCFKESIFRVPQYTGIEINKEDSINTKIPDQVLHCELTKYLLFNVKGSKVKSITIQLQGIGKTFSYLEMNKILPHMLFGCKKLPKNMLLLPFINYDDLGNSLARYDTIKTEIECDNFKSCYMTIVSDKIYMEYNKMLALKYSS